MKPTFKDIVQYFANVALIVIVVVLLVEFGKQLKEARYQDSIENPENQPFVLETAFNLGIDTTEVTQEQFNERYGIE